MRKEARKVTSIASYTFSSMHRQENMTSGRWENRRQNVFFELDTHRVRLAETLKG